MTLICEVTEALGLSILFGNVEATLHADLVEE